MRTLISKIATLLLAPVILSASCLSCFMPATPAYAALTTQEMEQAVDCVSMHTKTSFEIKQQPQLIEPRLAIVGSAFTFHTNPSYYQWSPAAQHVFPRNTILLTGTTIKKE